MSRLLSRGTQVSIDLGALAFAFALAFLLRFDWSIPAEMLKRLWILLPYVVAFQYLVLSWFGVPRCSWRYFGLRESTLVVKAVAVSAAGLLAARLILGGLTLQQSFWSYALVPIGVITIDTLMAFLGITGIRVIRRMFGERSETKRVKPNKVSTPTLLIGAGQAGVMVAKEVAQRPDLGVEILGFVDDDRNKLGTAIHGIRVLGSTEDIPKLSAELGVTEAIITIANAPSKQVRRIAHLCQMAGLSTKIVPGVYEIVGGRVNLSRIRKVAIEDLLGREPVKLEEESIFDQVKDRTILVTGAGGSIGSELCRQLVTFGPRRLVLVEHSENSLFHIHRELIRGTHGVEVIPVIGNICDEQRMTEVFRMHAPRVVYHAAAHKHVPMMEWNPREALKNNTLGTQKLADVADRSGVESFVMISTDKAVNPTSVMGASKRAAEIYLQALSARSATKYVTVRFGNVLGSAGSVIPIFEEQIARGGPVTVTHPDMERYFMTIPEACQLVLQASAMGEGREIFILDMGKPVKIVDLARDLIALSGFTPNEDIEIQFSGIRPGEKLFEELSVEEEQADTTRHPKIFVGKQKPYDLDHVTRWFDSARLLVDGGKSAEVRARLGELIPEMREPATDQSHRPDPSRTVARTDDVVVTDGHLTVAGSA